MECKSVYYKKRKGLGANILAIINVTGQHWGFLDCWSSLIETVCTATLCYTHTEMYHSATANIALRFHHRLQNHRQMFCGWKNTRTKECVTCKHTELAPTSIDFWQHCKWLMKPTTLRLLAPQVSQVNHFLVWWTFVRIRVNNFSSFKSCNKIKDTYCFRYNYAFCL